MLLIIVSDWRERMANTKEKLLITVLQEYVPYYLARYVEWYMSPENKRCSWEDLCKCDWAYKLSDGSGYKTPEFAEQNWLPRTDVQNAMQAYLKYFKKQNLTKLYQSMLDKAMSGDVRAADWVVKFSESEFFNESDDEVNSFLDGINIKGLEEKKK